MAIDRFQNKDILVSSKVPVDSAQVYSLEDINNLISDGATYSKVQLQPSDYDTFCKTEAHIYSADIYYRGIHPFRSWCTEACAAAASKSSPTKTTCAPR